MHSKATSVCSTDPKDHARLDDIDDASDLDPVPVLDHAEQKASISQSALMDAMSDCSIQAKRYSLFIGNVPNNLVPKQATERLYDLFSIYGALLDVKSFMDRQGRPFAFVSFKTEQGFHAALDKKEFFLMEDAMGCLRKLRIEVAKGKSPGRTRSSGQRAVDRTASLLLMTSASSSMMRSATPAASAATPFQQFPPTVVPVYYKGCLHFFSPQQMSMYAECLNWSKKGFWNWKSGPEPAHFSPLPVYYYCPLPVQLSQYTPFYEEEEEAKHGSDEQKAALGMGDDTDQVRPPHDLSVEEENKARAQVSC